MQEGPDPIRLGPNEYACPLCSKIMKKKNHMEDHIRIHTGEKSFRCIICNHLFTRKSSLNRHKEKCSRHHELKIEIRE